jgi:amidohydrolase
MCDYIREVLNRHRPDLSPYEDLYRHLHSNPELSYQEAETSKLIAEKLSQLGSSSSDKYTITVKENIGGYGLVGILKNGNGPVIMLRADMDALPILEKTGLPYASSKRATDRDGVEQPVMHACGHDMHITSLIACAETMVNARSSWSGTLLLLFQPSEEKGTGAQSMIDDGLYDPNRHNIPIPDVVFSAHVTSHRSGFVGTRIGLMAGAARNYKVTLHGRGGHASLPNKSIDPVVMAAYATTRLQTLVSREASPQELTTALTVACLKAGEVENVIPQEAEMKIDLRSSSDIIMKRLEDGMKRIINAEAQASAAPKSPTFEITRRFPMTWNSQEEAKRLISIMQEYFGRDPFDGDIQPLGMSEDFSILASAVDRPSVMWIFGGTKGKYYDQMVESGKSEEIPSNHSAYFAPAIQPTLQRGVDGYALCALAYLARR